ncbi:hypothetical protein D9M68_333420 [compost metagenome]
MVVGDGAPAHQRRDDRNAGDLGEFGQEVRGVGVDDAAAGDDQRTLRLVQHGQGLLGLGTRRLRLIGLKRLIGVRIELDLGELDVDRQVDQHRAGTAGAHDVESLLEDEGNQRGLHDGNRPLGYGCGDLRNIDSLEVFLVEPGARRLPSDAEDRDRIRRSRIEAGDHVGAGRARRTDADADIAMLGAGITFGHMRGTLDVAGENVADGTASLQSRIERVDGGARYAEGTVDAFLLQNINSRVNGTHLSHGNSSYFLKT